MMATVLVGCYRASEANDPEMFIASASANLACYPEVVVRQVCDPVRGLAATSKWLPAIAEIRAACEQEMVWHDVVVRREHDRAHTRKVLESRKAAVDSSEHGRVVEGFTGLNAALVAKTGPRRRPPPDARYAPTPDLKAQVAAHYEARLEELAKAPPPALSEALAAKYKPERPEDAWPGPPQPAATPEPSWARDDEPFDDVVF
jgi:hypothetical protein